MGFFLAPLLAKLTASAIGKAAIGGVVSAMASNIGRKTVKQAPQVQTQESSIDLVKMRREAERAGFNPLSVMRAGGISAFTNYTTTTTMPAISKQSLFGQIVGGVMTNAFDAWANKDIDAYNAEIRNLELQQRKADLSISRKTLGMIGQSQSNKPTGTILQNFTETTNTGAISKNVLVPGTGKTLDEILADVPLDVAAVKTGDGRYVRDQVGAALSPIITPGGNVIYVPWDPQDADLGAIAGGVLQYGALSVVDRVKDYTSGRVWKNIKNEWNLAIGGN